MIPDLVEQRTDGAIRLQTFGLARRQFPHALDCAEALILQTEVRQPVADITPNKWVWMLRVANTIGKIMGAGSFLAARRARKHSWIPSRSTSKRPVGAGLRLDFSVRFEH